MRKFFLAAVPALLMGIAVPAFSQGVQTPSAANANPPAGIVLGTNIGNATRLRLQHRRHGAQGRAATSEKPAQQPIQDTSVH